MSIGYRPLLDSQSKSDIPANSTEKDSATLWLFLKNTSSNDSVVIFIWIYLYVIIPQTLLVWMKIVKYFWSVFKLKRERQ